MSSLYSLAILGSPTDGQLAGLETHISSLLKPFSLRLQHEVAWVVPPNQFKPKQQQASAAVYFGGPAVDVGQVARLLDLGIPVIPVASEARRVAEEIPDVLRSINCLLYSEGGIERVATALLECVGLLPRQRRIFVSYRRGEAREAALQLFDALSSRLFDVFLDTHGIPPAEDFQAMLWHRLCDCDVLLMLDTPGYFESRWTSAEFGRALAKGISVLRVGWPDSTPSSRTATASRAELLESEIDASSGRISDAAIERICAQLEAVRSQSHAVRTVNLVSNIRNAVELIGGRFIGVGPCNRVHLQLPGDRQVVVHPAVGVPTSTTLHEASGLLSDDPTAIVFDHVGLHPTWLDHLDWLGKHIKSVRCIKASDAGWEFADWEAKK